MISTRFIFTVAPKIDRRNLRTFTIRECEPFIIDVKVIGEPIPDVTWCLGGKSVQLSHSRRIDNIPYNSKYSNDKAERKDSGTYVITAINKWGQDVAEIEVTVVCKYKNCSILKWFLLLKLKNIICVYHAIFQH